MKNIVKYIWILIILVIVLIILHFLKSNKNIFEDIMIFGLWDYKGAINEYEITLQNTVEIDLFTTFNKNKYKKIAPGSRGNFIIKFKRPENSKYEIKITEKTLKPQNLIFFIENNQYKSLKEMEEIINHKFLNMEEITIYWEWKYYIDDAHDVQDTKDGEIHQTYQFEIGAIVEERTENEI